MAVAKRYSSSRNGAGFDFMELPRDRDELATSAAVSDGKADYPSVGNRKALSKVHVGMIRASIGNRKFERHTNPDGTVGGFVEKGITLPSSVYLGADCVVMNRASIGNGCVIRNKSAIGGNAKIGKGVQVEESDIGFDSVVGDGAQIKGCTLRYETVVGNDARLYNVHTKGGCSISGGIDVRNLRPSKRDKVEKNLDGGEPIPNARPYLFV